jgi:hypothetical protein
LTEEDILTKEDSMAGKGAYMDSKLLGQKTSEPQIVEEDFLDQLSDHSRNSDMDTKCQGWQSPKSKRKKKNKKKVMVASRTSSRVPRDGIPVATKEANRAMAKNTIEGNSTTFNPFTLLNNSPTACLEKVILDLGIDTENVEEQIDIFKAEELARAAIAEANYKAFLDKQKERQESLYENQMDDLTMEVCDNKGRGVMTEPTKGGLVSPNPCAENVLNNKKHQNEMHVLEC